MRLVHVHRSMFSVCMCGGEEWCQHWSDIPGKKALTLKPPHLLSPCASLTAPESAQTSSRAFQELAVIWAQAGSSSITSLQGVTLAGKGHRELGW